LYTLDKRERDRLVDEASDRWMYEKAAFYTFPAQQEGTSPIYCLRSLRSGAQFYTISDSEKDELVNRHSDVWAYEGVAFYAYPDRVCDDLVPVFRFCSDRDGSHFYTARAEEKDVLLKDYSPPWIYEGIAWYTYGPF
jgi:hypothetical protein